MTATAVTLGLLVGLTVVGVLSLRCRRKLPMVFGWLSIGLLIPALAFGAFASSPNAIMSSLVFIFMLAAGTIGGSPVVVLLIHFAFRGDSSDPVAVPEPSMDSVRDEDGLPATTWIGFVERFAFLVALGLGFSDIAAIIFGIKALGQYASKGGSNRSAATRILGTLTSAAWALACFAVVPLVA